MTLSASGEPWCERIVNGIRSARSSVTPAELQLEVFRAQQASKPGTPITEQWNDFCEQVEALHKEVHDLHERILRMS
jgi:hypothetical protein